MDYQSLHMKTVADLKKLAKDAGVRLPAGAKKQVLIEVLLEADREAEARRAAERAAQAKPEPVVEKPKDEAAKAADEKPATKLRGRPPKAAVEADAGKPARRTATRKAASDAGEDAPKAKAGTAARGTTARNVKKAGTARRTEKADPAKRETVKPAASEEKPVTAPSDKAVEKPEPFVAGPEDKSVAVEEKSVQAASAREEKPAPAAAKQSAQLVAEDQPAQSKPPTPAAEKQSNQTAAVPSAETQLESAADNQVEQPAPADETQPEQPASAAPDAKPGLHPVRPVAPAVRLGTVRPQVPARQGYVQQGQRQMVRPGYPRQGVDAQRPVQRGYVNRGYNRAGEGDNRPADTRQIPDNRPGTDNRPTYDNRQAADSRPISDSRAMADNRLNADAQRPADAYESGSARGRREGYYNAEYKTSNPAVPEMLATGECNDGAGVLEIQQDGYGFLRAENCLPGPNDVYISIAQIRRFNLREGDYVVGKTRPQREGDRYSAMLYITSVNGETPEVAAARPRFEDLVPVYPDQRLRLEPALPPEDPRKADLSLRLVDMLAPIGKGQRGMIVSQPKAGKTTLLKKVANAITDAYPDIELIVLLIDERPEEVTDMKRSIKGDVIYSTFDEAPENHVRVSEMVLARAQRLVEMGKDVVVLMDSITRLARAYNLVITPTGRSLSGGLDPGALFKPKRFFGAARNIENGGSLTVIATALIETGSRMDDIIYEEFKGTGNMELHLDRKLSDRRVFPAIDMVRSGTRREELLLTEQEQEGEMLVRRVLSGGRGQEMAEQIIDLMSKTTTNAQFFERLKGWIAVFEKEGFTLGGK